MFVPLRQNASDAKLLNTRRSALQHVLPVTGQKNTAYGKTHNNQYLRASESSTSRSTSNSYAELR